MEYISQSSGLLNPSMVNTGDKIVIIEPAYSTFVEKSQKTYWNAKVQLPDGSIRLAGLFESACDAFADKWGNMTENWVGHTIEIEKKIAKSGNEYLVMIPTNDPIVELITKSSTPSEKIEPKEAPSYTADDIDPNDIPF